MIDKIAVYTRVGRPEQALDNNGLYNVKNGIVKCSKDEKCKVKTSIVFNKRNA